MIIFILALVLYLVIHKEGKSASELAFAVQRRYVTPTWNYIGRRESLADAVERRRKAWGEEEVELVTDDTHVGLRVTYTSKRVAELVLRISAVRTNATLSPCSRRNPLVTRSLIGRCGISWETSR
jgi:hypothetical protein